MKIEELKKLEPSLDNRIRLKCYNGKYIGKFAKVLVIGLNDKVVNIIDNNGYADIMCKTNLANLEPIRAERKKIELGHFYCDHGNVTLLTSNGESWIRFGAVELRPITASYTRCPNMKNIFIYEDDFSIVDEE